MKMTNTETETDRHDRKRENLLHKVFLYISIVLRLTDIYKFITELFRRQSAAAYMAGSLKTVAHTILSPYGLYLYLYMYGCGCTYRVTLRVFS